MALADRCARGGALDNSTAVYVAAIWTRGRAGQTRRAAGRIYGHGSLHTDAAGRTRALTTARRGCRADDHGGGDLTERVVLSRATRWHHGRLPRRNQSADRSRSLPDGRGPHAV